MSNPLSSRFRFIALSYTRRSSSLSRFQTYSLSRFAGSPFFISFCWITTPFLFFQQKTRSLFHLSYLFLGDMLPSLPLSASILLCLSAQASAAPQSGTGQVAGQTLVLRKRAFSPKTIDDWGVWAKEHREGLQAKYGDDPLQKRSTGTNL